MSFQSVVSDIDIADYGDKERVMNSDIIGKKALKHRKKCSPYNSRAKNSGSLTGMFSESVDRESEYCREHDGIE